MVHLIMLLVVCCLGVWIDLLSGSFGGYLPFVGVPSLYLLLARLVAGKSQYDPINDLYVITRKDFFCYVGLRFRIGKDYRVKMLDELVAYGLFFCPNNWIIHIKGENIK